MRADIVIGTWVAATLIAAPSLAHHSISRHYDRNDTVTVEGVVVEFLLRNPHSQIRMEVQNASGAIEVWTLEMDDAEDILEQGIVADTIRAGDVVVATGNPARDGSGAMFVRTMMRPVDGLEYFDD